MPIIGKTIPAEQSLDLLAQCEEQFGRVVDGEPYEDSAAMWDDMSPEERDEFFGKLARSVAAEQGVKVEVVENALVRFTHLPFSLPISVLPPCDRSKSLCVATCSRRLRATITFYPSTLRMLGSDLGLNQKW